MTKALSLFILATLFFGCASVRVYNRTDMFIDIEANTGNAWIGCSDTDLKADNSLMTLYILDKQTVHQFMFRRVLSVKRCLRIENEYRQLLNGVSSVRMVGIQPVASSGELITSRVPKRFKETTSSTINWTFIRFSTQKGCEPYFQGHCKEENYWGGVLPPNK